MLIKFIGTNKSHFVIHGFCCETIRVGRLDTCDILYLRVGHSKTDMDRVFAADAHALANEDYYNM